MQSTSYSKDIAKVVKHWGSGDYIYGAVDTRSADPGTHYLQIGDREYPVARLYIKGVDANDQNFFGVDFWCKRSERFPEPIKGWN